MGRVAPPGGRPTLTSGLCPSHSQLLVMETSSTPLHICLPPTSSPTPPLLCGSDDGLFYFNTQLSSKNSKR